MEVLNLNTNETFRLDTEQCEFGYRESIFKHRYQQGYVITAVGLKLKKDWQPILKYGSLVDFDPKLSRLNKFLMKSVISVKVNYLIQMKRVMQGVSLKIPLSV